MFIMNCLDCTWQLKAKLSLLIRSRGCLMWTIKWGAHERWERALWSTFHCNLRGRCDMDIRHATTSQHLHKLLGKFSRGACFHSSWCRAWAPLSALLPERRCTVEKQRPQRRALRVLPLCSAPVLGKTRTQRGCENKKNELHENGVWIKRLMNKLKHIAGQPKFWNFFELISSMKYLSLNYHDPTVSSTRSSSCCFFFVLLHFFG